MNIKKLLKSLIVIFSISFTLTSCNPGDARKIPPNVDDRVMKNIQEGRGFRFQDKGKILENLILQVRMNCGELLLTL